MHVLIDVELLLVRDKSRLRWGTMHHGYSHIHHTDHSNGVFCYSLCKTSNHHHHGKEKVKKESICEWLGLTTSHLPLTLTLNRH